MVAHRTYSSVCAECQCTTLVLRNLTRRYVRICVEHGRPNATVWHNYSHCGITLSPYWGIQVVEWFDMVVVALVTRVSKWTSEGGGGVEGDISQSMHASTYHKPAILPSLIHNIEWIACYLLQSMASAHGCCPLWVAKHITMVETVHMALEGR